MVSFLVPLYCSQRQDIQQIEHSHHRVEAFRKPYLPGEWSPLSMGREVLLEHHVLIDLPLTGACLLITLLIALGTLVQDNTASNYDIGKRVTMSLT